MKSATACSARGAPVHRRGAPTSRRSWARAVPTPTRRRRRGHPMRTPPPRSAPPVRPSGGRQAEDARGDDVLLDLRRAAHDALRAAVEVHLQRRCRRRRSRRACRRPRARRAPTACSTHVISSLSIEPPGPCVDAVEALRQPAAHVQPQHLRLDDAPTPTRRAWSAPERGRDRRAPRCSSSLTVLRVARDVAELARLALVADDRHRQRANPRPARRSCSRRARARRRTAPGRTRW